MAGLTPKIPLALSTEDGTYELIKTYKDLVRQNFMNLIMTSPGERIMDPMFGVGIRNFLFENDSPTLYASITATITEQVRRYMPFVELVNVNFVGPEQGGPTMPNNFLSLRLEYRIVPLDMVDNLSISIPQN